MPPKGKSKALSDASSLEVPPTVDAPSSSPVSAPAPAPSDSARKGKGKVEDSGNVTHAEATASGSGVSLEEKLRSLCKSAPDSGFLEDDSDEELEVEVKTEAFNHVCFTAILLLPVDLSLEVASVITTVRTLMRRVWASTLSDGAAESAKFQELLPAYVAKTRYSRLQVSLLREDDIVRIRSKEVDYARPNGAVFRLYWQHTDNPAFVRERATNAQAIEVMIRDVPATKTPEMLRELMVLYQLRNRKQSAFKDGVCFHRVLHPVTGADTDVIKGLVIPHPGDRYRWRHVFQDPLEIGRRFLLYHATASLPASPLITPILLDPAIVLISTGGNREEWICTQVGCGKAKGKSFMSAADHITSANHLIHLEQLGSATRASLEKASLTVTKKDYGI
ncbi:unnamed protein product [Closterium sp. Naga37s-1]|nr:unnamed protein product [Closterium sp. Naga37s-1]